MKFHVEIDCDNDAFQDVNLQVELARILRDAAYATTQDRVNKLRDINGNFIGAAWFEQTT